MVDEGSNVKAGDTLTLLDCSDWEIQLDQAKANVAAAEAQYKLAVQGAREEDITQAEATLKNAEDDLNRTEGLFKDGSITEKQLDDARTRHILAKQNYDKLKRGSRPEEIDVARARRDQAAAQVKAIKKKIDDSFMVAPIAEFTPKNDRTKEDRTKLVFGVKIEIPNREQTLKPGMPADAFIELKVDRSVGW